MGWRVKKNRMHVIRVERPVARTDELIVEELDSQVLIYDRRTNEAHCLSHAAAQVWRTCDGKTSREQLARQLELDADTVEQAIDELEACRLLDGIANGGITRREATARFAKVGAAAAAAAPLIYSVASPTPAAAQTVLAQCLAINAVAGHDCGNNPATPGCGSVAGCCCCHNFSNFAPCAGDPQHCCVTAAFCTSIGGNTCSNG